MLATSQHGLAHCKCALMTTGQQISFFVEGPHAVSHTHPQKEGEGEGGLVAWQRFLVPVKPPRNAPASISGQNNDHCPHGAKLDIFSSYFGCYLPPLVPPSPILAHLLHFQHQKVLHSDFPQLLRKMTLQIVGHLSN